VTDYRVKDLMVPLSEYATVQIGSTLFEAVMALEKAQEEFDHTQYRHRAVLILGRNGQAVGKLTQVDVLRALESESSGPDEAHDLRQLGFGGQVILAVKKQKICSNVSMRDLCKQAVRIKVEDLMQTLSKGEYVEETTPVDVAIHQLLDGNHLSLMVTRQDRMVGILRLSDVFAAVFHTMKECDIIQP